MSDKGVFSQVRGTTTDGSNVPDGTPSGDSAGGSRGELPLNLHPDQEASDHQVYRDSVLPLPWKTYVRQGFKRSATFKAEFGTAEASASPRRNFGSVKVTEPSKSKGFGTVTVKDPPKSKGFGTVTVKDPPKLKGFGAVIRKAMGIRPKPFKVAHTSPSTHVAGVEVPHELRDHFQSGSIVPREHPLREKAAQFVTDVWRRSIPEGRRMSEKILGISHDGPEHVNVKPGYATVKSEVLVKEEGYDPKKERPNQRQRVKDVKADVKADPSKQKVSLSTTNSKLMKDGIASFNLVPIETCPGAGSCAKYCYADTGSFLRFWKTTMPPRVANWIASQKPDFVQKMNDMFADVKKRGKVNAVRIHDSGDFYSPQYIDKWTEIARDNPELMFYAYTKAHHPNLRSRLDELQKLPNVNVVQSLGSKYDHLVDPSKPHAVIFPDKATMDKAGYKDAMESDLVAADKNNRKVGLYIHGQYDKSYNGLEDHLKDNPQLYKEIMDSLKKG